MSIIVIAGPTAVGKTKLSVSLAKKLDGEIINADSLQVYKELNIGTAKITEEEKEGVPHHLFDIKDVEEMYTIYDYQKDCRRLIDEIIKKGKTPILVGGSGLYIRAALYNYSLNDEEEIRDFSHLSDEELYFECLKMDYDCNIHDNNRKRLERFLNIKMNGNDVVKGSVPLYDFKMIGLTTDREVLYDKINKRVDKMIEDGLIDEVKKFYDKGIRPKSIMTGVGYKELYSYFDNEISLEEAIELIKKNSRHLAKRQYTFFNNQFDIKWFNTNYDNFDETIEEVYNYIKE